MKVILLKNIQGLGREGDLKEVANGYARNYLLPQKLAIFATESVLRNWKQKKETLEKKREKEYQAALIMKEKIDAMEMNIVLPGGGEDRAFGSIRKEDIVKFLEEHDIHVSRNEIQLDQPIKKDGEYAVQIFLGDNIRGALKVVVRVS